MFSKNFKRKVAVLLTGVMILGMTVTAAAETGKTGGSDADGTGTFEGHVNRKVVDVTLPTVAADTFSFIVDSEGLMAETKANNAQVWNGYTFPTTNTNVYFTTGTKKFDSTSNTMTLSNNSSVSINVALKVDVIDAGNLKLLSSNEAVATAKDPSLWLGLKVDDKAAETVSESGITKTVSVNGTKDNYEVSVNEVNGKREYTFVKKAGALSWQELDFALTGAANKVDSAKDTVAPTLKVTWNYEAAEWEEGGSTPTPPAADKAPSIATTTYTMSAGSGLDIPVDLGTGSKVATNVTVTHLKKDGVSVKTLAQGTDYTFANSKISFTADALSALVSTLDQRVITVTFNDTEATAVEVTIKK